MDKNNRALLELPLVRFAPFMAAGMLTAYFGGGLVCGIVSAAAAAVTVLFAVKRKRAVICAAGLLWGIIVTSAYLGLYCAPIKEFGGKTVQAEIKVNEISCIGSGTREYVVEMNLSGRRANVRVSGGDFAESGTKAVAVVELAEPDSGDEFQDLADGILLEGVITETKSVTAAGFDIAAPIRRLRQAMVEELSANVFGERAELALSMLLGEDGGLSPALREKLKICGAAHYTAVSGSHFALFAAVLLGMIPDSRKRAKQIVSLLFAPAALVFFGLTPSVLRASVMFLLYSLASLLRRKADTLNSLCLAVVLICTFSPGTVLDLSFAMSVLGVFGVGVVGVNAAKKLCGLLPEKAEKPLLPIVTALSVSVGAVVCTSPVSVFAFKGVSLGGAFVSLLLMPLMTVSMSCMVLLGLLRIDLPALPIDLSMGIAKAVVDGLGDLRGMWLTLDFKYAWVLAALCAAALTFAAFGDMRAFGRYGKYASVLALCTLLLGQYVNGQRSEVRFTGNSTTGAAVIIEGSEAVVFVSGSGTGLATSISRTMREHGAVKISCLAAFDADYGGALAIRELSRMTEIDAVYSGGLVKGMLTELNVITVPEDARLSVSGITFAAAKPSDKDTAADIVLYNGRFAKTAESQARYAVYFSSAERELPENWHNARRDKEFYVRLEHGTKNVSIIK
ncbi:MAG: ComEC/Rec2 family competence protein [Ruminococcus sp.]|nr:ComEC/Rec2 family competence protein [Ruminococcus sp.]